MRLPGLPMPFLGMLVEIEEEMGWGTVPRRRDAVPPRRWPARDARRRRPLRPHRTTRRHGRARPRLPGEARMSALAFLDHNRVELALHTLPRRRRPGRCCCSTASASARPTPCRLRPRPGPGRSTALDFTGHGASTLPVGGGYTAEILLADADAALAAPRRGHRRRPWARRLRRAAAGGRPLRARPRRRARRRPRACPAARARRRRNRLRARTGRQHRPIRTRWSSWPRPASARLRGHLRPPGVQGSELDEPITVVARFRPPWLRAVVDEPGVAEAGSIGAALQALAV